jgi:two-component system, HptB-dependent secretion and biofilm response regulator
VMNILYIEDNADDAKLVARFINTTGHHLVTVENLEEAYAVLSNEEVGMVMLDIVLNRKQSGYQFASDLRANDFKHPIVAVTALNTPASLEACEQAGIDYVLSKPYSIMQLADMINLFTN